MTAKTRITAARSQRQFIKQVDSSVGYFADAQYDVLFVPYRHFVPLPPKEEARLILGKVCPEGGSGDVAADRG